MNILGLCRIKGSGKEDGKRVKVKLSLGLVNEAPHHEDVWGVEV
jgi:hypothetical protein